MVRAPFIDKNGLKKGAWSEEEDKKLRAYVQRYGHWNWRQLPRFAGLARCGKSCRLRWMNYLKPGVRRGNYTPEEEEIIHKLHEEFGTRWSLIASKLPGRTDNEIKNHWHSHLRKRATHEHKSMTAAGETSIHFDANNRSHEHYSSSPWGTSDSIQKNVEMIETNNVVVDENVYREVSSFYYDPAATLFDDIGALDWAVLAEILSPVENIMNPSDQESWSHPFSLDASHTSLHHQLQLPPLMEQEGDEVVCPNVEEDDIINWLHDLLQ